MCLVLTILSVLVLTFALSFALVRNGRDDNINEKSEPQIFSTPVLPPSIVCDAFYCAAVKDELFGENIPPVAIVLCMQIATHQQHLPLCILYSVGLNMNNSLFDCIDHPTVCTNNTTCSFVSTEPGNQQKNFKPSHMKTLPDQPTCGGEI
jgi:hypothetical protein